MVRASVVVSKKRIFDGRLILTIDTNLQWAPSFFFLCAPDSSGGPNNGFWPQA